MAPVRPQQHYRSRLLEHLREASIGDVLEVGCGGGEFLRDATAAGFEVGGIDTDAHEIDALRAAGHSVQVGEAAQLPKADASVDAVVFCFSAHHIADWPPALAEALRVAKRGVFVLDPWYETAIPSQRVAEQFDRWCKRIDRSTGMVHRDCLDTATLLALPGGIPPEWQIRLEKLLIVQAVERPEFERYAAEKLAKLDDPGQALFEIDWMRSELDRDGMSDDGAILLSLLRG